MNDYVLKMGRPLHSAGFRLGAALSYIKLGGPLLKTGGPLLKTGGPLLNAGGPLLKTGGPLLKTGGPLRLGFEAPADCEALSCGLFSLCLNPALPLPINM